MRGVALMTVAALVACDGPRGEPGEDGLPGEPSPPDPVPTLVLPATVFAVEGREASIYFENVTPSRAAEFAWDVDATAGDQQADRWSVTPTTPLTPRSVTIAAHDWTTGELVTKAATTLMTAASAAGDGLVRRCIFVGDSLTNAGIYTTELLAISSGDSMGIELLGTRGSGLNRHEGRPGWRIAFYASDHSDASGPNPFWIDGRVDFPGYLARSEIATPDWVFIMLGTNDVFSAMSDEEAVATADSAFDALDVLLNSVRAAGPDVRIGLMTPPPPSPNQDFFGDGYGVGQTAWRFKRNILLWDQEMIVRYDRQTGSRVFIVPTHLSLDTVNNMANGVHPAASGHRQIAESAWAFLKNHP